MDCEPGGEAAYYPNGGFLRVIKPQNHNINKILLSFVPPIPVQGIQALEPHITLLLDKQYKIYILAICYF